MSKGLTAGFASSLILILIFALTNHLPASSPIIAALFNALNNLAYGFAASCIFYFINIYLPQKAKENKDATLIASILAEIKKETIFNLFALDLNFESKKQKIPSAELKDAENPHSRYNSSTNSEYKLKAHVDAAIFSVNNSDVRTLLISQLSAAIKPTLVSSFDGEQLQRHLLILHSKIEIILFELQNMRKNKSRLASLILQQFPRRATGFEHALSYEKQKQFLELLPEDEIFEIKRAKRFPEKHFPSLKDYSPYIDPINPDVYIELYGIDIPNSKRPE